MVGPSFLLLHLIAKPVDGHSAGSVGNDSKGNFNAVRLQGVFDLGCKNPIHHRDHNCGSRNLFFSIGGSTIWLVHLFCCCI
jgi:hypothetical protein